MFCLLLEVELGYRRYFFFWVYSKVVYIFIICFINFIDLYFCKIKIKIEVFVIKVLLFIVRVCYGDVVMVFII